jgi:hypothetical protein
MIVGRDPTWVRTIAAWAGFAWRTRTIAAQELVHRIHNSSITIGPLPAWVVTIALLCFAVLLAYLVLSYVMLWPLKPFILIILLGIGFGIILLSWL